MEIVRTALALAEATAPWRGAGETIAFVPTMGALHAGHTALVGAARTQAGRTVASVFVNPSQFGEGEDFGRYPRREAEDAAMLAAAGCDLLFAPEVAAIYPAGFATRVSVGPLGERLEGAHRPGHFDGVATVVARLFGLVRPDAALFGEKDWQQLAVIRRMVADLALPVAIIGHPTVREADGLAMSSRNAYLSAAERAVAPRLHAVLQETAARILAGEPAAAVLKAGGAALGQAGYVVDYLALADPLTLAPADRAPARLLGAARLGATRLIDNIAVG